MSTEPTAVPIANLHPELAAEDEHCLKGVVTLIWPYSSSSRSLSLLLVEPDFRLRARHGQVRLHFSGASAKAVAKAEVTSGDNVTLSLKGVTWAKDDTAASTPGKGIEWQLQYGERLELKIRQESGTTTSISVDHPALSPEPSHSPYDFPPYNSHIPTSSRKHPPDYPAQRQTWESPAFLKRGRFLTSAYDPFTEDVDFPDNDRRKRTKFGYGSGQWKYTEKTPSPVKETNQLHSRIDQETPSRPPQNHHTSAAIPFTLVGHDSIRSNPEDVKGKSSTSTIGLAPMQHQKGTSEPSEEHIAAPHEDDIGQTAPESPEKLSTESYEEPMIASAQKGGAEAVTQAYHKPLPEYPGEPLAASEEESGMRAATQSPHKLRSEAPVESIAAPVEESSMQAATKAPHKLPSKAPEEPLASSVEESSIQAATQSPHKLPSEAPVESIAAPVEESSMQAATQSPHKLPSEASEGSVAAPVEESSTQAATQSPHKLPSEAPVESIAARVEESSMQAATQPPHELSSNAPDERLGASVEESSMQGTSHSPSKPSLEATEEPIFAPLEELNAHAAPHSPQKLPSEAPEEPRVVPGEEDRVQATLQSPPRPISEHAKGSIFAPIESDTMQSALEPNLKISSGPFKKPLSLPPENEQSTEEMAIQASVDLHRPKHYNEDLDALDVPFTLPVVPSSQQQEGTPSPSTSITKGEVKMVQDSSPKSVISIGSSPSPSISSSEQSEEPSRRIDHELSEDNSEPSNEVAFQFDDFGRTTTTDDPPNFGFDGSMISKFNSQPYDIPIDPELASLSASKDEYPDDSIASSGRNEYVEFLNRASEGARDVSDTRIDGRSSVHPASLQESPSSQESEAAGSSIASGKSAQDAIIEAKADQEMNSAAPGALLTERPRQIGQVSPPPELAPASTGEIRGLKSDSPEEIDAKRTKDHAPKPSQRQIIDLESEEDDETETAIAPQVHQAESQAYDSGQMSQASPQNRREDLGQPLEEGPRHSEGAPEGGYSDGLADDHEMSMFSGKELIVKHHSSISNLPSDESPKAVEDLPEAAQLNDGITRDLLDPPSNDPQASVASYEAPEQKGKLSLLTETPDQELDELPSTVPDSAGIRSSDQILTSKETQKTSLVSQQSMLLLRSFEDQEPLPTPGLTQGTSAGIEIPKTPITPDDDSMKSPIWLSTDRKSSPMQEHTPTELSGSRRQPADQFREHKATPIQETIHAKPSVRPPTSTEGSGEEKVSLPCEAASTKLSISPPLQREKSAEPEGSPLHKLTVDKLNLSSSLPDEKSRERRDFPLEESIPTRPGISPTPPIRRSTRHQVSPTPKPPSNKLSVSPPHTTKQSTELKALATHEAESHPADSSPPPFSPITPLKRRSALVEKLRARRLASESTPKSRVSNASRTPSLWFAPRRSSQVVPDSDADSVLSGTEKESMPKTPRKAPSLLATPEKSLAEAFIRSSPAVSVASSQYVPSSQPSTGGLRTNLSYFVPLGALPQHFGTLTDTFAIAVSLTSITRAKSGLRDFAQTLYLTDYSSSKSKHPVVTAQLFRPNKRALPQVQPGSAIMLRNFKVQSFQHQISLLSTDTSAWVVFHEGTEPQVWGPPIEFGAEERAFARGHWKWWASLTDLEKGLLSAAVPRETPIKANGKTKTKATAIEGIGVDLPGSQSPKGGKKRDQHSTQALAQEWGLDGTMDGDTSDEKPVTRRRGLRPRKGGGKTASESPEKEDLSPRPIKGRSKYDSGSDKDQLETEGKDGIRIHELRDGRKYNDRR